MNRIIFFLALFLILPSCFAGWFDWLQPQRQLVMIPFYPKNATFSDINAGSITATGLFADFVDANAVFANYWVARNWIDYNFLHNADFFGNLNVQGDANFVNIGTGGMYASGTVQGDKFTCDNCTASGANSVALVNNATASGGNSVALGEDADASNSWAIAMGVQSTASGIASIAIGDKVIASNTDSISIGASSIASGHSSIAIGSVAFATDNGAIMIGRGTTSGLQSIGIGNFVEATNTGSIVIGKGSSNGFLTSSGGGAIASGLAQGNVFIGLASIHSSNSGSVAIGNSTSSGVTDSNIVSSGKGSVAMGFADASTEKTWFESSGSGSVAMGYALDCNMIAQGDGSVVLGTCNQALNTGSIAIGRNIVNSVANVVALGPDVNVSGDLNVGTKLWETSLQGWWRFDADAKDYSGFGRDGTLTNGAMIADGVLTCPTHNDFLDLDAHATAFAGLTEGTISFWGKPLVDGENDVYVTFADASEADSYLRIWMDLTDKNIHVDIIEGGVAVLEWESNTTGYNSINWHHFVYSSDAAGNSIEIDGLAAAGVYATGNAATQAFIADVEDVDKFYLADAGIGSKEEIDELLIFNRRLSEAERKRLYERSSKNAYLDTLRTGITGVNVSPSTNYWIYVSENTNDDTKEGIFVNMRSASNDAIGIHSRTEAAGVLTAGLFELKGNTTTGYGIKVTQDGPMFGGTLYGVYSDIVTGGGGTIWNFYADSVANNFLGYDNAKTFWGTAKDASIYYNGTNLIVNPKEVGKGSVYISGDLNVERNQQIRGDLNVWGSISLDGNLLLDNTVWDDLSVAISTVRIPAAGAPTWATFKGGQVLAFAGNADNNVFFSAQLPHGYKEETDIYFHIHYIPEDNAAGNVRWVLNCSWANQEAVFPDQSVIASTLATPGVADQHTFGGVGVFLGTGKTISSVLLCGLGRMAGSEAVDTYDNKDIYLASLDFHFEKDTIGSDGELSK